MSAPTRRILSGIQPTGIPHLGNYLGALQQWVQLQHQPDTQLYYSLVDLHAITIPYSPQELRSHTLSSTASLLACGLDPARCAIFRQSSVRQHSELCWLLTAITPLGWLQRMTQYKSKSAKHRDRSSLGLLAYPVLQAADILLYQATHVPVGEDQQQHLELCRDIAVAFNAQFPQTASNGSAAGGGAPATPAGTPVFTLPETLLTSSEGGHRVMSLRDASSKMSKSDPAEGGRILLTDTPDTIVKKVRRAKTDSLEGLVYDPETRPERSNLLRIFAAVLNDGSTPQSIAERYRNTNTLEFKNALADAIIARVEPMRREIVRLEAEPAHLESVLAAGGEVAAEAAENTMVRVREAMGMAR